MNHAPHRSAHAFTLVEVMLAATMMLMGIVGMMHVIVQGSEMLETSRKQAVALQIIHNEIEKVRLLNFNALPSSGTVDLSSTGFASSGLTKGFTCTRTVSTPKTDFKQLTYTVTWTGGGFDNQRSYSRSSSTYVSKNGLYASYQK